MEFPQGLGRFLIWETTGLGADMDIFWSDTLWWVQTCASLWVLILVTSFVVFMVLDPPKQDTTYCQETNYGLAVGDTKQICCPVSGYPPPFFTWKKDGVQLKGEDSVLTITISGEKDFGNYTCSATDFRTSSKSIYISVKEKGNYVRGLAWMIFWLKSPVNPLRHNFWNSSEKIPRNS